VWWKAAALFYSIYIFLYTTIFTNGNGFFTGIIGSLGYWLEQQGVNRGSQPWYFYSGIQVPIYEFLPAIGTILAIIYAITRWVNPNSPEVQDKYSLGTDFPREQKPLEMDEQLPVWLLIFWSLTALLAYSLAGEKMPWLTVHIAWPMILAAGWAFGRFVTRLPFDIVRTKLGWLTIASIILLVIGLGRAIAALNSVPLPFSGNELDQLSASSNFLLTLLFIVGSIGMLYYVSRQNPSFTYGAIIGFIALVGLGILTFRASFRANFINYNSAKEYLVYAHAARGPKDILAQVEEISQRMTGGKTLRVGYDNSSLYPYWWYFRDYTNTDYFADTPTKGVRDDDIVLVGNPNYMKIEPLVGKDFYSFEYERLWWPNQDYFNLTWERVWNAIKDPNIRAGIFQIWLNRDYAKYAEATESTTLTPETWEPAERIRMYIKKGLAAQIWNYGLAAAPEVIEPDPNKIVLTPDVTFGTMGELPGQFNSPRGLAVAPDGSIFIADSRNHRIQHYSSTGEFINGWGSFADVALTSAPGGTFNEPWDVAVASDGSVFVTDTWNHRVQKFAPNGDFISMWGIFGQAETPDAFWGPRGIAIGAQDKVYVTDTGNKRVVIFQADGTPITSFGTYGLEPGQFDEPVGIDVDDGGNIYVADTWNRRVQVFSPDVDELIYNPVTEWEIDGWESQSLDNKPFLAVGSDQTVFLADPETFRILEFGNLGDFIQTWGEYSPETDGFGLPSGIAVDTPGGIWVSDAGNNRILHFTLP
jgi:DNA-binding beta-propeller fold protein YncE